MRGKLVIASFRSVRLSLICNGLRCFGLVLVALSVVAGAARSVAAVAGAGGQGGRGSSFAGGPPSSSMSVAETILF
jgi:hypothetical protein